MEEALRPGRYISEHASFSPAAVEYFGRAQRCFAVAGLPDCWDQLVDQVRANHYRKAVFIREFEKVVMAVTPEPEPSLLGKAGARWAPPE